MPSFSRPTFCSIQHSGSNRRSIKLPFKLLWYPLVTEDVGCLTPLHPPCFYHIANRRKTAVDELNMRSIFEDHDIICAEVHSIQHGIIHLQTRSQKYGKLKRGQLLKIPPYLVKKRKQHFHYLDQYGIDLILGCNGFIWVGEHVEARDGMVEDLQDEPEQQNVKSWDTVGNEELEDECTPLDVRENISRTANAIRTLSILGFMIRAEVVAEIVNLSVSLNLGVHEMVGAELSVMVAEKEAERRSLSIKKK